MPDPEYIPTLDDLNHYGGGAFERAYADTRKRRERCSREDFAAGYIAAVIDLRAWSHFTDEERLRIPGATPATPRSTSGS
jgi:hypothetical protein